MNSRSKTPDMLGAASMIAGRSLCDECVGITAGKRRIEGLMSYPFEGEPTFCALIAGPHPFLGGELSNNVTTALRENLAASGAVTLTFNYGGVGSSEGGPSDWPAAMSCFWKDGRIDAERDWAEDTAAALAWLRSECDLPVVLIGYSFGCWTISQLLGGTTARAIVLISPNPAKHGFDGLNQSRAALLVLHSDNDFTSSVEDITNWFDTLRDPKSKRLISAGEHFFRGRERDLTRAVLDFLNSSAVTEVRVR